MRAESERVEARCSFLEGIRADLAGDATWSPCLTSFLGDPGHTMAIHLAIFNQPYLDLLLDGSKTVESRFSAVRCAPFYCVRPGDMVLVKRSGGPIVATFLSGEVWNYRLNSKAWRTIRERFGEAIAPASPAFWSENESASYATLIEVRHIRRIRPIVWDKSDRRGWVVVQERRSTDLMLFE